MERCNRAAEPWTSRATEVNCRMASRVRGLPVTDLMLHVCACYSVCEKGRRADAQKVNERDSDVTVLFVGTFMLVFIFFTLLTFCHERFLERDMPSS